MENQIEKKVFRCPVCNTATHFAAVFRSSFICTICLDDIDSVHAITKCGHEVCKDCAPALSANARTASANNIPTLSSLLNNDNDRHQSSSSTNSQTPILIITREESNRLTPLVPPTSISQTPLVHPPINSHTWYDESQVLSSTDPQTSLAPLFIADGSRETSRLRNLDNGIKFCQQMLRDVERRITHEHNMHRPFPDPSSIQCRGYNMLVDVIKHRWTSIIRESHPPLDRLLMLNMILNDKITALMMRKASKISFDAGRSYIRSIYS